jgi:hypothetical protein
VVGHARDEGSLRADYHEVDLVLAAQPEQPFDVVDAKRMAARESGDSGVPRRRVQLLERLAPRDFPRERVLAAP